MDEVERRLDALEAAVAQLRAERAGPAPEPTPADPGGAGEPFWLVAELRRRNPDGAVVFGGHVDGPDGPVEWQWGATTDRLLSDGWESGATTLAALGHPVRLHLLQQVLGGRRTTAELADDPELGTSGQLHHHLRTLVAAGWLQTVGRARYTVPAHRVVPLLVVVSAAIA